MKQLFQLLIISFLISCSPYTEKSESPKFESIRLDRYAVKNGNPDSITLSSYIVRSYDEEGFEEKSIYYSTDNSIMMQFINEYQGGNKSRVNWVNQNEEIVRYVSMSYDENDRIIRSETFNPEDSFMSGFVHRWKEDGRIEEKAPIEEGADFKPNAIYIYDQKNEFDSLKEFDENDSLYYLGVWDYMQYDEFDNWTERRVISDDTIRRVEKRLIVYRK